MRDAIRRMVTKSKMTMTSREEIADIARIWDELETTFQRKDMFSAAETRLNENISVIENHSAGDARLKLWLRPAIGLSMARAMVRDGGRCRLEVI